MLSHTLIDSAMIGYGNGEVAIIVVIIRAIIHATWFHSNLGHLICIDGKLSKKCITNLICDMMGLWYGYMALLTVAHLSFGRWYSLGS